MAKRLSPTGSDRPPSILSPHGEGYCRWCQFVVGLDAYGLLERHCRGRYSDRWDGVGKVCEGSHRPPPKLTPQSSRKAMFRTQPVLAHCPGCVRDVQTTWAGGVHVYGLHKGPDGFELCTFRYRAVVTD